MLPFRIMDRVKFVVERQLVKGAGFQLLVVGQKFASVGAAVWWAFITPMPTVRAAICC
ncbi:MULTISPECIES: hypothetical protein [unclassified Marinobacter]|uniref:hypothetical protein n=1 Tax=unclassified Marinobacter TaxID=83889 RepID=UPI000C01A0C7|nr:MULTISPECIES: hypothetical protein [unclassified Marinobacter]PFG11035.1 hypothetical protein ATI45_3532 [Marinobacter sp. LV10MA510-1]PFG52927.1 hypothetical protein ATG98_1996 [Marinobacter sp. LV10R520-4]